MTFDRSSELPHFYNFQKNNWIYAFFNAKNTFMKLFFYRFKFYVEIWVLIMVGSTTEMNVFLMAICIYVTVEIISLTNLNSLL